MIPLVEYFTGIDEGKIVAGKKMRLTAKKVLSDYYNPGKYHFDERKTNRPIEFIEGLCKQYKKDLLLSESTAEQLRKNNNQIQLTFVDESEIRGRKEKVNLYSD